MDALSDLRMTTEKRRTRSTKYHDVANKNRLEVRKKEIQMQNQNTMSTVIMCN